MNISGLLGISRSGLNHLQTNLDTTANNIANVNTTGFKRSRAQFEDRLEELDEEVGPVAQFVEDAEAQERPDESQRCHRFMLPRRNSVVRRRAR